MERKLYEPPDNKNIALYRDAAARDGRDGNDGFFTHG
jgi:hypothetical protein